MIAIVNGREMTLSEGTRLQDVLLQFNPGGTRGVAIALNGEVVPRAKWSEISVREGDRLEVLRAVGGG